jgi:hypothetical protein
MASIESITLDMADPRPPTASTPPPLIVSEPATVNGFIGALDAGAMPMKPAANSFCATAASYRSRTDDLAGLDLGEEGYRLGHSADRRDRDPIGSRGRGREQAVLR